jgi:sarcosine oxidase subunit gamma
VADLIQQSPWQALAPVGQGAGVVAAATDNRACATVMARKGKVAELAAQFKQSFGVDLIDAPKRTTGNGVTLLGVGPGKWLAITEAPDAGFVASLAAKLDGLASVVEQSDALAILKLSGPQLAATLEKGFQIDLQNFAIDDCAVTSVDHIGVTLWKPDAASVEIAVARSLAGSLLHWLHASAAVHGFAVQSDQG